MQMEKTKKTESYQQIKWGSLVWFLIGAAIIITVGVLLK